MVGISEGDTILQPIMTFFHASVKHLQRGWQYLTKPATPITHPEDRYNARLLSSVLVVAAGLSLLFAVLEAVLHLTSTSHLAHPMRWGTSLGWLMIYGLSRSRYFRLAVWGTILNGTLEVVAQIALNNQQPPLEPAYFLIIMPLVVSVILSVRETVLLILALLVLVMGIPQFLDEQPSALEQQAVFFFLLLSGSIVVLITYHRNQLERMRVEELAAGEAERLQLSGELARQYHLLDAIVSSTRDFFQIYDPTGRLLYISPASALATQLEPSRWLGKKINDLPISEERRAGLLTAVQQVFNTGQVVERPTEWATPDGVRYFNQVLTPYRDETGRVAVVVSTAHDMTNEHQQAQKLQKYVDHLTILKDIDRAILEAQLPQQIAEQALLYLRRFVQCERASVTLFDFKTNHLTMLAVMTDQPTLIPTGFETSEYHYDDNAYVDDLKREGVHYVPELQTLEWPSPIQKMLIEEGIRSSVGVALVAQGELIGAINLNSKQPHFFAGDHIEMAREVAYPLAIAIQQARLNEAVKHHANELERRVEERTMALVRANDELKQLDALKTKFVADISHEFRTPLAVITTRLYLLQHDKKRDPIEHIGVIQNMTNQLAEMVDDIVAISRLDAGETPLEFGEIDLNELARSVYKIYGERALAAGLAITLDLAPSLPPVLGESAQLLRAVSQLVENAIFYTPHGTVRIMTGLADLPSMVQIAVGDTGVGIEEDEQAYVFERFYRGKRVSQLHTRGTGLGLAIVRKVVELHEGKIDLDTQLGVGTTFTVKLPSAKHLGGQNLVQ